MVWPFGVPKRLPACLFTATRCFGILNASNSLCAGAGGAAARISTNRVRFAVPA